MTHAELLARISSAELSEWQAYLRLEERERQDRARRDEIAGAALAGVAARRNKLTGR